MVDDPRTKPLVEWNRLARENTENAVVSSMFEAALRGSAPVETFSNWLLVAAAAVASFLVANANTLIPFIARAGFVTCGACLCLSCLFGVISKFFAVRCKIGTEAGEAVRQTFAEHLANYKQQEEQIQQGVKFWGIDLQTGIRLERVLTEFLQPFPKWGRWLAWRHFKKHAGNPQIAYVARLNNFKIQGITALLQALGFLGFLVAGFVFAALA